MRQGHKELLRLGQRLNSKIDRKRERERETEREREKARERERERESYDRQRVRERKEGEATKILRISLTKRLNMKKDQSFYVAS